MRTIHTVMAAGIAVTIALLVLPGAAADHGCGSASNPDAVAGTTNEDGDAAPLAGVCYADDTGQADAHAGEDYDESCEFWGNCIRDERVGAWANAQYGLDHNLTRSLQAALSAECETDPSSEDPNIRERCDPIRVDVFVFNNGDLMVISNADGTVDPDTRSAAASGHANVDEPQPEPLPAPTVSQPVLP
jgi:hypothetical protein